MIFFGYEIVHISVNFCLLLFILKRYSINFVLHSKIFIKDLLVWVQFFSNLLIKPFFRDPKRIKIWHNITSNVQKLVQICKILKTKTTIQLFLRYMPLLIKQFVNIGMPILEHNLKYQTDDVTSILKMMQSKK